MDDIASILKQKKEGYAKDLFQRHKYVTKEFQDYGYRIAVKLDDVKRASMYIKIAKDRPRAFVETAFSFAIDYPNAKNRGRIFLWKLKELEEDRKERLNEKTKEEDKKVS